MTTDIPIRNPWTQPTQPATAWEDEPIKRDRCLATVWLSCGGTVLDPMPTVCGKHYGHEGQHQANSHSGLPGVEWADAETRDGSAA